MRRWRRESHKKEKNRTQRESGRHVEGVCLLFLSYFSCFQTKTTGISQSDGWYFNLTGIKGKMRKGREIKISVRNLVEFLMRSGDIDNKRIRRAEREAMQEGSRIHRKIQRRMGADYRAEVALKTVVEREEYKIVVEGRADGIIERPDEVTIDEIKGIYMDLAQLKEPIKVHLAQAFCYAYMYGQGKGLENIKIQVTYCNLETEEIRRFLQEKPFTQLEEWFKNLIKSYEKWAEYQYAHENLRDETLRKLKFPYEYREGQRELAVSVYRAISRGKNLFIQAPTGIGKTLSTVYPALKAMGEGHGEKLFYLTAKTITRKAAEECFEILRENGLFFSAVTITAKEKLCPMEEANCNPIDCVFARGHYDRVNNAVFEIIGKEMEISREILLLYAKAHQVCPFEFCLDVSNWVDGIICDYNYVFDPDVKLKRYFSDGVSGAYIFLVDEAHNLVARAREMYSAGLVKEDFLNVKRLLKGRDGRVERQLERCNRQLLELKRECERYQVLEEVNLFASSIAELFGEMERLMEELNGSPNGNGQEEVLDFYFQLRHFLNIYENIDDHYQVYTQLLEDGRFWLRLFCIDPSRCLLRCLEKGCGRVFFSATLLPVLYYKKLLSGSTEDYAVYAKSPFLKENRMILIGADVSSRYSRRNEGEYQKVTEYICAMAQSHRGNYMVFFPSYGYMEQVERKLKETCEGIFLWQAQKSRMTEAEREDFLDYFQIGREASFVGLCVLGGIFSEGIDLREDRLEGVIVVGTGLPMVCPEQEILKDYFDQREGDGYDYAYQYPGMNKVLQAAGRVIRTEKDQGVILLLDDRFLRPEIQGMFPREWSEYVRVTRKNVRECLERFWKEREAKS